MVQNFAYYPISEALLKQFYPQNGQAFIFDLKIQTPLSFERG